MAVGATVWKGLAVHATYFGGLAFRPKVTQGGTPAESSRSTSFSVLGLGPGVTYHFQPLNVYVSYSAGAGWSVLRFYEHKVDVPAGASNPGFANELMIGKEWWVMRDLAIGAAAQGIYARVFDRGGDSANLKFNGFGAALLLSATYH